jgi:hypothetical protein
MAATMAAAATLPELEFGEGAEIGALSFEG